MVTSSHSVGGLWVFVISSKGRWRTCVSAALLVQVTSRCGGCEGAQHFTMPLQASRTLQYTGHIISALRRMPNAVAGWSASRAQGGALQQGSAIGRTDGGPNFILACAQGGVLGQRSATGRTEGGLHLLGARAGWSTSASSARRRRARRAALRARWWSAWPAACCSSSRATPPSCARSPSPAKCSSPRRAPPALPPSTVQVCAASNGAPGGVRGCMCGRAQAQPIPSSLGLLYGPQPKMGITGLLQQAKRHWDCSTIAQLLTASRRALHAPACCAPSTLKW